MKLVDISSVKSDIIIILLNNIKNKHKLKKSIKKGTKFHFKKNKEKDIHKFSWERNKVIRKVWVSLLGDSRMTHPPKSRDCVQVHI